MDWRAFEKEAIDNGLKLEVTEVPPSKQPTAESLVRMNERLKPQIAQNEVNQVLASLQKSKHALV